MKKFIIDARCIFDSGIGVYTRSIIKELIEFGVHVELILHTKDQKSFEELNLPVVSVHYVDFGRFSFKNLFFRPSYAKKNDVFFMPALSVPNLFISSYILLTIHDFCPFALRRMFGGRIGWTYWFLLLVQSIRADKIVCISEFTKSEFNRHFPFLRKKEINVVYNGLTNRKKETFSVAPENKYILCVGNVKPHKNVVAFAHFFEANSHLRHSYKLIVVGQSSGFRTGVNNEHDFNHVEFTGYVTDERLAALYAGASLFVFPSFYEGFGLPLIEAASEGIPVVCSDIPVFREVGDSFCGFFNPHTFSDFDYIASYQISSKLDENISANLQKRFSWKANVEALLEIVSK